jgi:basic membrane lipoprotein Med (substrate-binding protein (PBP1-ABC) superfamily)
MKKLFPKHNFIIKCFANAEKIEFSVEIKSFARSTIDVVINNEFQSLNSNTHPSKQYKNTYFLLIDPYIETHRKKI